MQRGFARALLRPDAPVPAEIAIPQAERRFGVYRNSVTHSLRVALAQGFPACAALLGDENFARVATRYLRDSPPSDPRLMLYGSGFPDFIDGLPDLSHMAYLGCVARLELALRQSYHAADTTPVPTADLARMTPSCGLRLAPSLRLVRSPWPVLAIHARALDTDAPHPSPLAQDVLVTRAALDPVTDMLPEGGAEIIHSLARGQSLESAVPDGIDPTATLTLLLRRQAVIALT